MGTQRILKFLDSYNEVGPVLVVDLNLVQQNMLDFMDAMPNSKIYYAVKANPDFEILHMLAKYGHNFDCASVPEINAALTAGAPADAISYGNTIKKQADVQAAYDLGVRLFAVDSIEEVDKIASVGKDCKVFCRILTNGVGAEWPLSRKFGCDAEMAVEVLVHAAVKGIIPYGVSFHVGSQMTQPQAWDPAIAEAKEIFDKLADLGIKLKLLNLGGGFPTKYTKDIPSVSEYGNAINASLMRHFGNNVPETIIEPGRGMVGNAGVIRTEVVLISKKSKGESARWVFLDIGKFGGLAETEGEAIRYRISSHKDADPKSLCVLAGPTCDSADVLYEKQMYLLPDTLEIGDFLYIESTGVYTSTYSAVAFNGFAPLRTIVI